MKDQLSLTALWLAPALALLAFATAGRPTSLVSPPLSLVSSAEVNAPPNYQNPCGNGIKGQYSKLHHGWVCSTELAPSP